MHLSSSDVRFSESVALAVSAVIFLLFSVNFFTSYVHILLAMLQRNSVEAQNKALLTCSPQIATFILFVIFGLFAV